VAWLTATIGSAAAICSMASFAPQVWKIWREKDASSVSLHMYAVTVVGFVLWIAYGLSLKSWPIIASNGVCLVLAAAILVLRLRYGNQGPAVSQRGNQAAPAASKFEPPAG
jgi:MtN3 and saliva related transmembrane protein